MTLLFHLTDTLKLPRIDLFDILRGLALVAMVIYHFTWDLEFFGWILPGTITEPLWVYFARGIASSFLILVGISLVLAHRNGIKWHPFIKRFAFVALSAALISIVTHFAFSGGLIFFGILHAIALFSLIGLLFVRLPWFVSLIVALAIYWVGQNLSNEVFAHPAFWWVGLATTIPHSNDYVPLFPWFSATLFGISFAKLSLKMGWFTSLAKWKYPNKIQFPLTFIGKNSLLFYLVHQPILLGLVWSFTQVAGPPDRTAGFVKLCTQQCSQQRDEKFCRPYCGCVAQNMKQVGLFTPFHNGEVDLATNKSVQKNYHPVQPTTEAVTKSGPLSLEQPVRVEQFLIYF